METEQDKNQGQPPVINMQVVEELSRQISKRRTIAKAFRINLPVEEAYMWLTSCYKSEVEARGLEYINDANTRQAIFQLAQALVAPNPKCGIMLCGTCGNGKTTLLYAFRTMINILNSSGHFKFLDFKVGMRIYDAKELVLMSSRLEEWRNVCGFDMIAIDDLGKEPAEVMDYGNIRSPLVDLLEQRYQRQKFTMITSNLAPDDIKAKYGERIADRFREMFEIIVFVFDSYRGKSERRNP